MSLSRRGILSLNGQELLWPQPIESNEHLSRHSFLRPCHQQQAAMKYRRYLTSFPLVGPVTPSGTLVKGTLSPPENSIIICE
mmetsp:Transcript_10100/g.27097  ORF Transcript_10100/g.27097 Transcript_10100/m.27097 type:complete len:82 (-) Transcript_10100:2218-2463(-)